MSYTFFIEHISFDKKGLFRINIYKVKSQMKTDEQLREDYEKKQKHNKEYRLKHLKYFKEYMKQYRLTKWIKNNNL